MAREIRTTRIEDWEGNIYKVQGTSEGGGIGFYVGAVDLNQDPSAWTEGNTNNNGGHYTSGSVVGDPNANDGMTAPLTADPQNDKNLATVYFDGLHFGMTAIMIRAKSSVFTGETDVLRVNCYYVDNTQEHPQKKVSTTLVKGRHFGANDYTEFGFVTNFYGQYTSSFSLKVEIVLIKGTNASVSFNCITACKAFAAVTGTPTVAS